MKEPPPQLAEYFWELNFATASAHTVFGRRTLFRESSGLEIMSRGLPLLAHPNLFRPAP
jgi:hypothetical protein